MGLNSFFDSHLYLALLSSVLAIKEYVLLDALPEVVYDESTLMPFLYQMISANGFPPWAVQTKVMVCPNRIVSPSIHSGARKKKREALGFFLHALHI